ncbi:MAG: TIGR02281 family clan AA aspartic protease [Hyphomicrobiales bacterium]
MSFLWVLLAGLAVLLITLIVRNDAGTVLGMDIGAFGQLGVLLALLAFIGLGMFRGQRFSEGIRQAFFWVLMLLVLVGGYSYRDDLRSVAHRLTGELIPGLALSSASGETVTVNRGLSGHFQIKADVEGTVLNLIVDTGASDVVLTSEDAEEIGIDIGSLVFKTPVDTANGRSFVARVTLESILVGPIALTDVRAAVAQPGNLSKSLLGNSFLDRLSSYEFSGSRLELRP